LLYILGYWLVWIVAKLLFRFRIEGRKNLPRGGTIIAPNHASYWDPPLVGAAMGRYEVYFMAKKELFRFPIFGTILKMIHTFPIDNKKQDVSAIRKALSLLNIGKTLVVFPEGGRAKKGRLRSPQPGIAWLAHRTGLPVVPTLVVNTHRVMTFPRVSLRFGPPIYFQAEGTKKEERFHYDNFSRKVMEKIIELDREKQYQYQFEI